MNVVQTAWREVSLGDICEFRYGKSLPEKVRVTGEHPVYGSNGAVGSHVEAMTAGPTIVVGRKGSIGEISFSYQPCWPIDTTYFIDTTCTKQDLRWLSRALATLGLAEMNKSAAVPGLNREDAYRRRLLLPPLPEQRRIAAILDEADALRAKRRAALAQLEELIQSMFLELISGHQSRHWSRVMLPDAFWFQEGPGVRKWQFTESGVKLLNVGNIERDGSLNLAKTDRHVSEEEAYRKYRHFLADEGDLVIASSGISFDDDGLLRTRGAFVSLDHLPLCMNTSTIRFKALKDRSDLRFLWVWLNSVEFRSQITRLVTGSAQQNFGPSHLKALEITLPPLSVQASFADQVAGVEQLRKAARIASVELDSLFASLQKRAFRGEL